MGCEVITGSGGLNMQSVGGFRGSGRVWGGLRSYHGVGWAKYAECRLRRFISLGIVPKAYASGLKYEVDISMFRTWFLFFLRPLHPLLASFCIIKGQLYLYTQPTPIQI